MNRYVIALLMLAGFGLWWGYSSWQEDRVKTEERRAARQVRVQALKNSVAEMVAKANAVTDWAAKLSNGDKMRTAPVLTAELQKQWQIDRPILFTGNLRDVALNSDGTYQVLVEYNWINGRYMFDNDIFVSLRCSESIATRLIHATKEKTTYRASSDVAVVGGIYRIDTTSTKDREGNTVSVLTGIGRCIDAVFLTERLPG
jgi:hypothetical protein